MSDFSIDQRTLFSDCCEKMYCS